MRFPRAMTHFFFGCLKLISTMWHLVHSHPKYLFSSFFFGVCRLNLCISSVSHNGSIIFSFWPWNKNSFLEDPICFRMDSFYSQIWLDFQSCLRKICQILRFFDRICVWICMLVIFFLASNLFKTFTLTYKCWNLNIGLSSFAVNRLRKNEIITKSPEETKGSSRVSPRLVISIIWVC